MTTPPQQPQPTRFNPKGLWWFLFLIVLAVCCLPPLVSGGMLGISGLMDWLSGLVN